MHEINKTRLEPLRLFPIRQDVIEGPKWRDELDCKKGVAAELIDSKREFLWLGGIVNLRNIRP